LSAAALDHYREAKTHLQNGDLAVYGRALDRLKNILKQLSEKWI
jgi:flagellin-specific chaperone FliS